MLKLKYRIMHIVLFQILLVYFIQVASITVQFFFIIPLVRYFMVISYSFKRTLDDVNPKKFEFGKNVYTYLEWSVLLVLIINITRSSNTKIVSLVMYGWDFVGHFGVFRWGLNNLRMISSEEILNSKNLESFLDSDYPQTYDLWGANYFRLIDFDTFGLIKAMLVFAIATLFFAYKIFAKTYFEVINANFAANLKRKSKNKRFFYNFIFLGFIIQFISFCWTTNCPHFALSTALIFRASVLSAQKLVKDNTFEIMVLMLIAYVLYPLTIICAGLLLVNIILRLFYVHRNNRFSFFNLERFLFVSILIAIASTVVFKNGRNIALLDMLQSYGGVEFPVEFLGVILIVIFLLVFYLAKSKLDLLAVLCLVTPVLVIDVFLISSQGLITYYGAKATISFLTIACGLLILRLNSESRRKISVTWFYAITILCSTLLLTQSSVFKPTFVLMLSRGFPTSVLQFFNEIELKNGWASGRNVSDLLLSLESNPKKLPLITGGYPYLGNMWLTQAGRYPAEIWSDKIEFNGVLYNPIYFVSRDLNLKQRDAFLRKYPYIYLVENN